MDTKPVKITIIDNRTPRWLRTFASVTIGVFGPIALGIATDSTAMQWAGFIMGALMLIGLAQRFQTADRTFDRASDAKAYIDGLAAREADPS